MTGFSRREVWVYFIIFNKIWPRYVLDYTLCRLLSRQSSHHQNILQTHSNVITIACGMLSTSQPNSQDWLESVIFPTKLRREKYIIFLSHTFDQIGAFISLQKKLVSLGILLLRDSHKARVKTEQTSHVWGPTVRVPGVLYVMCDGQVSFTFWADSPSTSHFVMLISKRCFSYFFHSRNLKSAIWQAEYIAEYESVHLCVHIFLIKQHNMEKSSCLRNF